MFFNLLSVNGGQKFKKMFIFKRERKTMVQFQGDIFPIKSLIAGEKQQHAAKLYNVNVNDTELSSINWQEID